MKTTYSVKFVKNARKYFNKLDKPTKKRIQKVIDQLMENPYTVPNVKPLSGFAGDIYRIRIGPYRVIYKIEDEQLLVLILKIGPRGDIYK